jgi:hypothetical protein
MDRDLPGRGNDLSNDRMLAGNGALTGCCATSGGTLFP